MPENGKSLFSYLDFKMNDTAFWRSLPFMIGSLFATLIYLIREFSTSTDPLMWSVVVMWLIFSFLLFKSNQKTLEVDLHKVIDHQLEICGIALGKGFRLNIMSLCSGDDLQNRKFRIEYSYNVYDKDSLNYIFDVATPGVGTAYVSKEDQYIDQFVIENSKDSFPKHIFSFPIFNRQNIIIGVLNIDTKSELTDNDRTHIKNIGRTLRKTLGDYV